MAEDIKDIEDLLSAARFQQEAGDRIKQFVDDSFDEAFRLRNETQSSIEDIDMRAKP